MIGFVVDFFNKACWVVGIVMFIQLCYYLYSHVFRFWFSGKVDVMKKYNSNWALITGGSSGIGSQLVDMLAKEGMNFFIVAYPDQLLEDKINDLRKKYPKQSFYAVGANFADKECDYVQMIEDAIKKADSPDVGILINNAGIIRMEEFVESDYKRSVELMMDVNVNSAMKITHYFMNKWKSEKRKNGYISFTSSCSVYYFQAYCAVYTAAKEFIRSYCGALTIEAADHNIDVTCILPQIVVGTNFWPKDGGSKYLPLKILFFLFPSTAKDIARMMRQAMGKTYYRDCGWLANALFIGTRLAWGIDNFQLWFLITVANYLPFLKMKKKTN